MNTINWDEMSQTMLANSARWFPDLHASQMSAVVHFTLGLAGEAGELIEAMDDVKSHPKERRHNIALETADVVTYTCDIAAALELRDIGEMWSPLAAGAEVDLQIAVGHIANLVKKWNRDHSKQPPVDDITDRVRMVLAACSALAVQHQFDLFDAIEEKVAICEARWG